VGGWGRCGGVGSMVRVVASGWLGEGRGGGWPG